VKKPPAAANGRKARTATRSAGARSAALVPAPVLCGSRRLTSSRAVKAAHRAGAAAEEIVFPIVRWCLAGRRGRGSGGLARLRGPGKNSDSALRFIRTPAVGDWEAGGDANGVWPARGVASGGCLVSKNRRPAGGVNFGSVRVCRDLGSSVYPQLNMVRGSKMCLFFPSPFSNEPEFSTRSELMIDECLMA
jgi:hypothetical protein